MEEDIEDRKRCVLVAAIGRYILSQKHGAESLTGEGLMSDSECIYKIMIDFCNKVIK